MQLCWSPSRSKAFLVQDGLYRNPCVSVCLYICLCICYLFSVFTKVNKTSTEASLAPVIDQLYSTNIWSGHYKCTVYIGWNKQTYNCSKQSVCSLVPRMCIRVPDSCLICRACFRKIFTPGRSVISLSVIYKPTGPCSSRKKEICMINKAIFRDDCKNVSRVLTDGTWYSGDWEWRV